MSTELKVTTILRDKTAKAFEQFRDTRDVPATDALAARELITKALKAKRKTK